MKALTPHSFGAMPKMNAVLDDPQLLSQPGRRARAAGVMLCLGGGKSVWPLLSEQAEVSLRIHLIKQLGLMNQAYPLLVKQLSDEPDGAIRQGIVLAIGHGNSPEPAGVRPDADLLTRVYLTDPDPGVHAAAEWAMRRWGFDSELAEAHTALTLQSKMGRDPQRDWFVNSIGQTMLCVDGPVHFPIGDPRGNQPPRKSPIGHDFAVSSHEVTLGQFRSFRKDHLRKSNPDMDLTRPADNVSWYDAAAFCNWLSEKEGLTPCYEPILDDSGEWFGEGLRIPDDIIRRNGYRLPSAPELECFFRATTTTNFVFGNADRLSKDFAWYEENSKNRTWPVGLKLPNRWGAFDVHGNLWEWTNDLTSRERRRADGVVRNNEERLLLGGAFDNRLDRVQSGDQLMHFPFEFKFSYGFRPARTLLPNDTDPATKP